MITALMLTLLALPFALTAANIGRRRWIRKRGVARVRAELALFHDELTRQGLSHFSGH
ncbi:hypothetical protein Lesp02_51320 [Lentzea sp. NBRC 105346]|uniref:hypothetical protein n=1 Tax=Lentzea sp. NBRC 105346 TaxID=3032205 RepID=UPI0024A2DDF0|nr:hypothetical protein [Lentzea sp. NBRC 105346]GLZ32944.1 hypothetical protein Lesp02_51320 [Lentzea sp. NBRC 105346]